MSNGLYLAENKVKDENQTKDDFTSDINVNVQEESENMYRQRLHKRGFLSANEFDFDLKQ